MRTTAVATVIVLLALLVLSAMPAAQRERKVTGVVTDAASQRPVVGAMVEYEDQNAEQILSTKTDAKGGFSFAAGTLGIVTVTARGYGTAYRRWPPVRDSTTSLAIALIPPSAVRGTVIDLATRRPLPAIVTITVGNENGLVSDSALSDDGSFEFGDLPPGPVILEARAEGYAPYVGSATVQQNEESSFGIGLLLEARVTGIVTGGDGKTVTGAYVSAWYGGLEGGEMLESLIGGRPFSDEDGYFKLDGLVPDTPLNLQAEFDGQLSDVVTVTVGPGSILDNVALSLGGG